MADIQTQLREKVQELRRTPLPLSEIIPLLTKAADRIDDLEQLKISLEYNIDSLEDELLSYQIKELRF